MWTITNKLIKGITKKSIKYHHGATINEITNTKINNKYYYNYNYHTTSTLYKEEEENAKQKQQQKDNNDEDDIKNKYEWMDGTVFDDNIKYDKRKLLKKELKRGVGFIGDIRELRQSGGKIFPANETLIDFLESTKFPNIGNVQPLDELLPKRDFNSILRLTTNLVLISFNSFGRTQAQEWGNVFKYDNPGVKLVEISASDNWGARLIEGWLRKSLRSTIDSSLHSTFFPIFQADEIKKLCNGLDIENRLVSYAYLVDTHGFVRWKGTGKPTAEELDSLLRCGVDLINDAKK